MDTDDQKKQVDKCLKLLSEVLLAIGVEELDMSSDHHFHTLRTDKIVDTKILDEFCKHVTALHKAISNLDSI